MTGMAVQPRPAAGAAGTTDLALLRPALSDATIRAAQQVTRLQNEPSPASLGLAAAGEGRERTLEERLFDAVGGAKILASRVAMHLDPEWRRKLFRQLDSLHDPAEWEAADAALEQSSFATFLKAMLLIAPARRPGLGLSSEGYLIAAWTNGPDRLTMEFLPEDRVRWTLTRVVDDEPEHFAAQTPVSRLREGLEPYRPETWFSHAVKGQEPSR